MDDALLSIVIPTLGRPHALASCLDAIAETVDVPHEVIVVTVTGNAETAATLASRPVEVIEEPIRRGYVHAANTGAAAARGAYLTILNDDCQVLPHCLTNAIRFLEAPAHDRVGQVAFFHDTPLRRNVQAEIHVEGIRYVVAHVRGLCYANFGLTRRDLFERLGGYDERYFMYGADPDFGLKVWHEAGLVVAPCPGALIHHDEVDDERAHVERRKRHAEDNALLFSKWDLGPSEDATTRMATTIRQP